MKHLFQIGNPRRPPERKKKPPNPFPGAGAVSATVSLVRRPAPGGNDAEKDYDEESYENERAREHDRGAGGLHGACACTGASAQ